MANAKLRDVILYNSHSATSNDKLLSRQKRADKAIPYSLVLLVHDEGYPVDLSLVVPIGFNLHWNEQLLVLKRGEQRVIVP